MRQNRLLERASVLLCVIGVGTIFAPAFLGKSGQLDGGRFMQGKVEYNLAAYAFLSCPLVAIATLCVWWRRHARLAMVGLLAAGIALGVTAWGNLTDYLSWTQLPPPTDQITYLGAFFAWLGSSGVCLTYALVGLVTRFRHRQ